MKALVMVAAAFFAAVAPLLVTDQPLSGANWINVAIVGLAAAQVYITRNEPDEPIWQYSKAIMAGVAVAGAMAISAIGDGAISGSEVAQIVVAGLGGIGVYLAPGPSAAPVTATGRHEAA